MIVMHVRHLAAEAAAAAIAVAAALAASRGEVNFDVPEARHPSPRRADERPRVGEVDLADEREGYRYRQRAREIKKSE